MLSTAWLTSPDEADIVVAAASFVRASPPMLSMADTTEVLALVMAPTDVVIRATAALTSGSA